ncbi:MAG: hypothetical protein HYY50_04255 [Candidatus Kerfeldbacteria bacterium]|nr:hypothetical protein [Candidatus Kerfeldbacteria bacterium]
MNQPDPIPNRSRLRRVIYPVVVITYLVAAIILALVAIRFLSTNLGRAIAIDQDIGPSQTTHLDLETYRRVARRLGIPRELPPL